MPAEFLIELKLHEEQDKIAQIVTGCSSTVKHSMCDQYINASKGKLPVKGKGKQGDGKAESLSIGSQAVVTGTSLSQVSSTKTARSMCNLWLHSPLYFSMRSSSEAEGQECRVG